MNCPCHIGSQNSSAPSANGTREGMWFVDEKIPRPGDNETVAGDTRRPAADEPLPETTEEDNGEPKCG